MQSRILLVGPLLLLVVVSYVLPFLGIMQLSFASPELGLQKYDTALTDPLVLSVFWRTLRVCVIVTLAAVTSAYVITFLWIRGTLLTRTLVELCIFIPFWISVLIRAFGWLAMLSNRGILNSFLKDLGIIHGSLHLVNNEFSVVVGMVHYLVPFAVFPLATAIREVDERVLLAAEGMGASRLRIFWQVFLPMTWSGVVGAALLVFVFALGFYVTPAILGGGRSVMIAELIYLRLFQIPDWGLAAAISVLLMLFVGGLLLVMIRRYGALVK